ncbi:MAG TPA: hypothetical protein VMM78_01385 [Thermomicrobiales bacterium]|nr:hypothetical protein [Thermomicrobiales bacterium]
MNQRTARFEPDQNTLRVASGGWCRVDEGQVTLLADDGDVTRTVDLAEVVSVRRGGPDLTLVRRDADPVTFSFTQVEHARTVESAVEVIITGLDDDDTGGSRRHRWQFWKRS